jgi:hypothetical protein
MGRISLLGTGNIAFSGSEMYTTNNSDMLFGNNLIPTTVSTFSIGSSANPFKTLFISASTLQMAAPPGGNNLSINNDGSNFQITNGGLRSTVIYTGGLLLSGNNIGADPAVGSLPMNIGTNGLPAVNFLAPLSAQSSTHLNSTSATNAYIGVLTTGVRTVSAVSAINVDFSTDNIIFWNTLSFGTVTITPINYTAGRTVEVFIKRPNQSLSQVNHGLGGSNSTSNSSFFLPSAIEGTGGSKQTFYLKYLCMGSTASDTYVVGV